MVLALPRPSPRLRPRLYSQDSTKFNKHSSAGNYQDVLGRSETLDPVVALLDSLENVSFLSDAASIWTNVKFVERHISVVPESSRNNSTPLS